MDILHTCTPEDGCIGEPSRRIELPGMDHELLEGAYLLSKSDFFDDDDFPERNLVLILQADETFGELYEQYQIEELERFGEAQDHSTLEHAQWEVQIPVAGWSNDEVDAEIAEVLEWHNSEIDRITKLSDG